ncbi:ABC transporter ATP-binding protein [Escherichia coli]|uniref:ABC transporter ATP-binding protein n=1 Tax=Escherichia coli TaxID=562 RepID=A0A376VJQ7_ECOLX|nr:ABC transporter ATP-binding protein [Escherichia coli]
MKILNREQGLDDGRIIYEQDLIVARLQQDPPRNVEVAFMISLPKALKNKRNT